MMIKHYSFFLFILLCAPYTSSLRAAKFQTRWPNPGSVVTVSPYELLTPYRFDVMAKYIYADLREKKAKCPWGKEIYAEHLRVWNNFKEATPRKTCLADFINAFNATLDSIKKNNFDPNISVIPIGTRSLIDGAHRTTTCLLYNKDITCRINPKQAGHNFSSSYFKQRGLRKKYLDAMALQYCKLKNNCHMVIVFPSATGKNKEIKNILKQHGTIVYKKKLTLSNNGPRILIEQLYDGESWVPNVQNVQSKVNGCFPNTKNPIRVFLYETKNNTTMLTCKQEIRKLFGIGNHSVHTTDTHKEAINIARIFFNKNSTDYMNNLENTFYKNLEKLLPKFKAWLIANEIKSDCACFVIEDPQKYTVLHDHVGDEITFNPSNHFYYKGLKFTLLNTLVKKKRKTS